MTQLLNDENRRRVWRVKFTDGDTEKSFVVIAKTIHAALSKTMKYIFAKKWKNVEVLEIVNIVKIDY